MDEYDVLGIDKGSTIDEIKKAYKKLATTYHPDRYYGDDTKFKQINEAYNSIIQKKTNIHDNKSINTISMPDITETITITLEQIFTGCNIPINIIRNKHLCSESITIPSGYTNPELTIKNRGHNYGLYSSNLIIYIKCLPHNKFTLDGNNLIYTLNISLIESIVGFRKKILYLDGTFIYVEYNDIVKNGDKFIIYDKGMKIYNTNLY